MFLKYIRSYDVFKNKYLKYWKNTENEVFVGQTNKKVIIKGTEDNSLGNLCLNVCCSTLGDYQYIPTLCTLL